MGLIPNKPNIPAQRIEDYNLLIFSEPGLGKTNFANSCNGALLTMFEASAKAILSNSVELYKEVSKNPNYNYEWEYFVDLIDEFNTTEHNYNTFGVDTITRSYEAAMEYLINTKFNGVTPAEMMSSDDSSGYSILNRELQTQYNKILNSKYGSVFTAHAKYKKIKDIKGNTREELVPDSGGSFARWLKGQVDIIIFIDKNKDDQRIFRIESTKDFNAKQRLNFEVDEILVETKDLNFGKYMYEVFKKEFDKAIENTNKVFGVTQKMIDDYYKEKEEENELAKIKNEIINICKDKGVTPVKNKQFLKEQFNIESINNFVDIKNANKYLKFIKKQ